MVYRVRKNVAEKRSFLENITSLWAWFFICAPMPREDPRRYYIGAYYTT